MKMNADKNDDDWSAYTLDILELDDSHGQEWIDILIEYRFRHGCYKETEEVGLSLEELKMNKKVRDQTYVDLSDRFPVVFEGLKLDDDENW